MKTGEHWRTYATDLWARGLTRSGQRNEALFTLAIDLAGRGVPRDEAVVELRRWLLDRNNGASATFNRDVGLALRDIEPIVATVYERSQRRSAGTWGSPRALSEYEVLAILAALYEDEARTDPATGELIDRYELERFLFEIVRRAKEWIAVQAAKGARARDPLSVSIWPDHGRAEFIVQIPKAMRRKIPGFGRHRDVVLWRTLASRGILRRVQGSSAKARRGARYALHLDFGALSENSREFNCLATALKALVAPTQIADRYGCREREHIDLDAATALLVPVRDALPHEVFVRERLGLNRAAVRRAS
jgi:hypothetical protein